MTLPGRRPEHAGARRHDLRCRQPFRAHRHWHAQHRPGRDVVVDLILPDGIGAFSPFLNSNGGTCPNIVNSSFVCEGRERVVWQIDMLGAGGFTMVSTVPPIPAATRLGQS